MNEIKLDNQYKCMVVTAGHKYRWFSFFLSFISLAWRIYVHYSWDMARTSLKKKKKFHRKMEKQKILNCKSLGSWQTNAFLYSIHLDSTAEISFNILIWTVVVEKPLIVALLVWCVNRIVKSLINDAHLTEQQWRKTKTMNKETQDN